MSQNRNAPAYQEYAAAILAQLPFRTMSLQERGLFFTMRLECWVNKQLPNNPNAMAKVFGFPADEVAASLPAVMPFFKIEGDFIICPELEDYREHLVQRKQKQSNGGKKGSAITNNKRNNSIKTVSKEGSSNSRVPRQGGDESLVQLSTVKQSQVQSSKEKDSFVKEMEEYEAKEENDSINNENKESVRI